VLDDLDLMQVVQVGDVVRAVVVLARGVARLFQRVVDTDPASLPTIGLRAALVVISAKVITDWRFRAGM